MLDLKTKKVSVSRDVTWLKTFYGKYIHGKDITWEDDEEADEKTLITVLEDDEDNNTPTVSVPSHVANDLVINTNEKLGTVADRSSGPRQLRSGKEIGAITWESFV